MKHGQEDGGDDRVGHEVRGEHRARPHRPQSGGEALASVTHTSEPNPKLKPMMNSNTPANPATVPKPKANTVISMKSAAIIMAMPDNRIGRRPSRSTSISAAHTAAKPASWTSAGRASNAKLPVNPMAWNS